MSVVSRTDAVWSGVRKKGMVSMAAVRSVSAGCSRGREGGIPSCISVERAAFEVFLWGLKAGAVVSDCDRVG